MPVVQVWYGSRLCGSPVVPGGVRQPVVLEARFGRCDRMLRVVLPNARRAGRDRVRCVVPTEPLVVPAWCCAGVVGTCAYQSRTTKRTPNISLQPTASRARSFGFKGVFWVRLRRLNSTVGPQLSTHVPVEKPARVELEHYSALCRRGGLYTDRNTLITGGEPTAA
jgi:hypothetical protein